MYGRTNYARADEWKLSLRQHLTNIWDYKIAGTFTLMLRVEREFVMRTMVSSPLAHRDNQSFMNI